MGEPDPATHEAQENQQHHAPREAVGMEGKQQQPSGLFALPLPSDDTVLSNDGNERNPDVLRTITRLCELQLTLSHSQQSIERRNDALQAEPKGSAMTKQEYQKQDAAEIVAGVWDVVAGMVRSCSQQSLVNCPSHSLTRHAICLIAIIQH